MKNELISVIVPIYNVELYLKECLDSIVNQTYKNLEIILVDDGSPDNCGKICDEYAEKDNRIKVIHKENGGLSSARNAGLDIATGEYISFIDSDDYVAENFIEVLYNLCKENDADIAECDFLKFENKITTNEHETKNTLFNSKEMQINLCSDDYIRTVVVWNKLYKKYIYEDLYFPIGKINEDEFIMYKVFWKCHTNIVVSDCQLYYYRCHSQSIMGRKFNKNRLDVLEAYENRNSFYKQNSEIQLYSKSIISYQKKLQEYYYLTFKYIDKSEKYTKDIMQKARANYKIINEFNEIDYFERIKMELFITTPKIYCIARMLKNFIKKK